jgi:hypothetical protein
MRSPVIDSVETVVSDAGTEKRRHHDRLYGVPITRFDLRDVQFRVS